MQHNTKQTCTVSVFSKHQTTLSPQTTIKQARFYKPCAYDKRLGFNKTAVVIRDSFFADFRHLCFNGCLHDMRHPFKVGFRNKHTANRRRSPINKHLSKIIVFTIRQRKIIRPQTTRINIICILHPFHVQNHKSVLMPTVNNTNLGFPRRVSMVIFFTIKNHLCAGVYAATICAIKSTQLKQDRTTRCVFFNARTVSVAIWQTFNLCRSQSDVQNTKAFSQQTILAQIKRSTV